jgi:dihydrofolate synthase/folylpolyglutamate synthase
MLGRYDATNVVDTSVAVVTNIDRDHTDGADGWRDAIASEKAGIVKAGRTLVLGDVDEDLHHWFIDEGPGSVLRFGTQFELLSNEIGVGGRVIDVRTPRDRYEAVLVALHGRHQGKNAAVAIASAEAFLESELDRDFVDAAFAQASMPGRMEVLGSDPLIVIDGGHNPAGARAAASTFAEAFHVFGRRILIVGMMAEKDPVEMLEALDATAADLLICCAPGWSRAMPAADLGAAARTMGLDPDVISSPAEAIEVALSLSTEGDAILVAGSLYVAGAVRNRLLVD